jgi:hypothetical protein
VHAADGLAIHCSKIGGLDHFIRDHVMLTPQDDLLGHQLPTTFDHVGTSDVRWTERYWYTAHPKSGELIFDAGLGYYPNRNVMDGFAGVTIGTTQYNFRASRRLRPNPLDTTIGPLRFQVIEGLRHHRVTLAPNESPLSFELDYFATLPGAEEAQSYRRRNGWLEEDLTRMNQFARWRGWLAVDGKRYEIDEDNWWGQRDHSWGVRSVHNTDPMRPPVANHRNFYWMWCMFQFEDFGISVFLKERAPGKLIYLSGSEVSKDAGVKKERHVVAVEHDITWADDPLGQSWERAELLLHFADGGTRKLDIKTITPRFYLKGGMYGGLNGWHHGDDRGALSTGHDVWDLTDAATRQTACTLSDHVCKITSEGLAGMGIAEYGVAAGYPRYEAPQRFPAI